MSPERTSGADTLWPVGDVMWLDAEEQMAWRSFVLMRNQLAARLSRDLAEESGLSDQDYSVLVTLTDCPEGRMRAFELGRHLGWEKSRLSHHISRMVERGLVARERCPSDQRGAFVAVTDQGREAIAAAAPGHVAAVRRYFVDVLTRDQLRSLTEAAQAVLARLEASCPETDCS